MLNFLYENRNTGETLRTTSNRKVNPLQNLYFYHLEGSRYLEILVISLGLRFSNLSAYTHLEGLLSYKLLAPLPEFLVVLWHKHFHPTWY